MSNIDFTKKLPANNIAFVGLTHLGLVTSICSASLGLNTTAIDEGRKLINELKKGKVDIPEPNLNELLLKNKKYFHPTNDFKLIENSSIFFITLDTPTDKPFNLKTLNLLIDKVIPYLSNNTNIILMSQIPVGFCRKLKEKILKERPKLDFNLYYFLNTLVIGNSIERFLKPERIIIGLDSASKEINLQVQKFLSKFSCPILKMSYESAELTKSAINLYLASSIITSNTLSDFCEGLGADLNEIIPALKSDKRIGQFAYLKPTLRISGGHLERELEKLKILAKEYKVSIGIVDPLIKLNNQRIDWLVKKIINLIPKHRTITLWGLSYKKDTESTDNSAALELITSLSKKYTFQAYDPKAIMPKKIGGYKRLKDKYKALKNSELLIILTDWQEFETIDEEKILALMKNLIIIDCVNITKKFSREIKIIKMGETSKLV